MAQQTINLGAVANDGNGDDLRAGGDKINDNFTELYASLLTKVKVTLSAAEIRGHPNSPVTLVAAPGANKLIQFEFARYRHTYGTVQFDFVGLSAWGLKCGSTVVSSASTTYASSLNTASSDGYNYQFAQLQSSIDDIINQPLVMATNSGAVTDATVGDSTGEWIIYYRIIDLS